MKTLRWAVAWLAAFLLLCIRATCRFKVYNDPRVALQQAKRGYIYALWHEHQLASLLAHEEPQVAAMVSRSKDGELILPAFRLRRVHAVRGSSRSQTHDKGGSQALSELVALAKANVPTLLTVDGPRGPRHHVHKGAARLAKLSGAVILPTIALANRRWVLHKAWDKLSIPKPFSQITLAFAEPIEVDANADLESTCQQLHQALMELEKIHERSDLPRSQT